MVGNDTDLPASANRHRVVKRQLDLQRILSLGKSVVAPERGPGEEVLALIPPAPFAAEARKPLIDQPAHEVHPIHKARLCLEPRRKALERVPIAVAATAASGVGLPERAAARYAVTRHADCVAHLRAVRFCELQARIEAGHAIEAGPFLTVGEYDAGGALVAQVATQTHDGKERTRFAVTTGARRVER